MAARHRRPVSATIAVLLLNLAAYMNAITTEAELEILPNGETQTKAVGSSIILTCKLKVPGGNPGNIKLQWFDPQNRAIDKLNSYGSYTKADMYTENHQDNSVLFINSLEEEQAGRYTCKGTYAGEELMKFVTINTIVAITWDDAPQNQYPILGEDFAIQCKVRAIPAPSVDWLYNGELIQTNDHYIIDTYSLKIKNVQASDDGVYTCRASVPTTGELQERPIRVEVHVRPTIDSEIQSQYDVIEGKVREIQCKASGKPLPKISWVKTLTQQNLSSSDRFKVDPVTGLLTIVNVNREDTGEYQCIASNSAGRVTTNIVINVIVKPKISEFLNMTVVESKTVEMRCKASGRPPPDVTFRKKHEKHEKAEEPYVLGVQPQDDRIILENKSDNVALETVGILRIDNVVTKDDGLYECIARNPGDVVYANGHLTVEFPPSFRNMPNTTVWSWENRNVNLTCIAESIPNATINWQRGNEIINNNDYFRQISNGPVSILNVRPANQGWIYTDYKCVATNVYGTREHIIRLREARRPGELPNVKMAELTATTIRFDLTPPPLVDLPIKTITVQYKKQEDHWQNAKNRTWSVGSVYTVEGLTPQTPYDFRFAASNDVGMGNWGSNHFEITPSKTVPNKPKILTTPGSTEIEKSDFNNQYQLRWVAPPDNGEPIDSYQIEFCETTRVKGNWVKDDNTCRKIQTQKTTAWLKGLKPDTVYTVELTAHNIIGNSETGSSKFRTARESANTADYPVVIGAAGDTRKTSVATITAAVILLSLAI